MTRPDPPAALPERLAELARERTAAVLERAAEDGIDLPAPGTWPGDHDRVLACSEFVATACARHPALLLDLLDSGDLAARYAPVEGGDDGIGEIAARFAARLEPAGSEDELRAVLRTQRRREWVRLAWRDLGGLADLRETARDASAYAEAALGAALDHLHAGQVARLGEPRDADGNALRMCVLALGKLGAGELNFSSDIDLIFVYPAGGETAGGERQVSNHEFFLRLGRRLVQSLSEATPDGYVFRVDMRLRPFGQSGPLVTSAAMVEQYYQAHGRDWERYALIRARAVAGDRRCGEALIETLRPFVYRRYLDFGALESIRDMKALINREISRKGLEDNVKLGPGGIREIEFTGQAFQMVRGGRVRSLRDRRIVRVLEILGQRGFMPAHGVRELTAAYRFLRDAEHRLQQMNDQQAHLLPEGDDEREVLAAGLGYPDWPACLADLDGHRRRVRSHFEQVLGGPDTEGENMNDDLRLLLANPPAEDLALELLEREGVRDPAAAWRQIETFRQSYSVRMLDPPGRERLERLFPSLVRAVAAHEEAPTLERVLDVVETIARRSAYLALLSERPLALSQLVRLCAASPWIARHIGRYPVLFDELLDPRTLYAPLQRDGLESDLAERLSGIPAGDTEQEMAALRQFKQANVLRVAAADISGALPLMKVSDRLTEIAEVVLGQAIALAWRDLLERHGEPLRADGTRAPFAAIGYGKLGGLELGYGSDLDLVFVHGSDNPGGATNGPKPIDHFVFFSRLAQRSIHFLTTLTADGTLYEVDSRLRPDGAKGVLVNGLDALRRYLVEQAWTWEHQALVRARVVAGDEALGAEIAALRREILLRPRDAEALRAQVSEMRARMREQLGSREPSRFDLKQDPGGIADIEFMVQYVTLRWASRLGEHLDFTDNIRLLEGFALAGLMSPEDAALLTDAYRAFRGRVHAQSLQEQPAIADAGEFAEHREAVMRIWQDLMEGDLARE